MLDSILELVKGEVNKVVGSSNEIPEDKKQLAEKELTHSLASGMQENFTPSNLSALTEMFSGGGSGGDIVRKLENTALSALTNKIGLSSGAAGSVVASLIPAITGAFSKKINDPASGFNIQSIIGAVSGEHSGGFMDKLKKLFS